MMNKAFTAPDPHLKNKPKTKPKHPYFASGPCAKHPLWHVTDLRNALVGRSHRAKVAVDKIENILTLTRQVLDIPDTYYLALISGSATAAMECLLWNLLGSRPVDVFAWDVFGQRWADDITQELKIDNVTIFPSGTNLTDGRIHHDLVFTWNATTSGVCVPQNTIIAPSSDRLVMCDATSAVFCVPLPWHDLDATAFSWQKGLGGEAGQGLIVLSPKAMAQLTTYRPHWPIPYLFRLSQLNHVKMPLFKGQTLNTVSMLVLEDAYKSLKWCQEMGNIPGLYQRTLDNFNTIKNWVDQTPWIEFLEPCSEIRSPTSVCLKFTRDVTWSWIDEFYQWIASEHVGFDIKNHRAAPPSLRIWAGPTVDKENISALLPWLTWAYDCMECTKQM